MTRLSDPILRDETLPEEIVAYKPYSPAAMAGTLGRSRRRRGDRGHRRV